ncbi:MAG: choloylglycine hydrolase family protein [Lachnospiraceae bacterium]|jgi:penicillin V acylase-like amidase (Ntn superfamily)|nr:choloylglycine hydrolase family protein [Lachnospiraceae bacterium]
MCTAITYRTQDFYFGRTLDYEVSYGEQICITPRHFVFPFRNGTIVNEPYAMIGMAHIEDGCPLYYDAVNEKGLAMAGLNFVGNAVYQEKQAEKKNVATFELIPWILMHCASVKEARKRLNELNLTGQPFNDRLPAAQLHWILADQEECITLESVKEGLKIYDNPAGVLTNNPPFKEQLFQLNQYMALSSKEPENQFSKQLPLQTYSRGMGALGLPGDLSSMSRFARAAFTKLNAVSGESELESVNQFFHILGSVEQPRGCCEVRDGEYEITLYTSCCNAQQGRYYYTTYDNHQITAVDMHQEDLEGKQLITYPLVQGEQIRWQNKAANH